jgi:hypothetical protein
MLSSDSIELNFLLSPISAGTDACWGYYHKTARHASTSKIVI